MFTIYIAKATEGFRLPVMHRIYEWFCQTIKQHKCAFDSLPSNASWVKLIVCMLFMPMYLSAVIHVCMEAKFWADRKSTRLNSSHTVISYAVFCLKKKKNTKAI